MRRFSIALAGLVCAAAALVPTTAGAAGNARPVFANSGPVVFDFVDVGSSSTQTVTVSNAGNAPLRFAGVTLAGRNRADFSLLADGCTGKSLSSGATCDVRVTFTPGAAGTRLAYLRFADNTPCANWITLAGSNSTPTPSARAATCETVIQDALDAVAPGATTTTTTTTTAPAPAAATPAPATSVQAQAVITLPKSCVSRRKVTIRLTAPAHTVFKKVTIKRGAKTIKTLTGKAIKSTVSLSGLPRGRFTLSVTGRLSNGKTVNQKRHYVTCVASKS